MNYCAPDWVSFHAGRDAKAPVLQLMETGDSMNWGQMEERVSIAAGMLAGTFGLKKGDRVSVIAENDFRVFEIKFACMRIGAIFVPLNWRLTANELSVMIADAEPAILFHDEPWSEVGSLLAHGADHPIALVGWNDNGGTYEYEMAHAVPLRAGRECNLDDVTHILYTSGTTGVPKGALVTHRMLLAQIQNTFADCALGLTGAKYLNPMPLFHAGGLTTLCAPILGAGGTVAFSRRFDPDLYLEWLGDRDRGITHFNGSPIFFEQIAASSGFTSLNFNHIRHSHVAGATIVEHLLESWAAAGLLVQQFYGGTEMGPSAMAMPASRVLDKPGSCGRPLMLTQARLVDGEFTEVAGGSEGEVLLSGPAVTLGYWRRERSASDFVDGWFRTGDVARADGDGFYYIVDRVKDLYKSGGESVFPAEIERALLELPLIEEVAVVGIPDTRWGEVGCAVVVPRAGAMPTLDDLHQHLGSRFARYKLPKAIEISDQLPRNALGKIDKKILKVRLVNRHAQASAEA